MSLQPVILCGGSGTRLRLLSSKAFTKQFVPLLNNKYLLPLYPHLEGVQPVCRDIRSGDVRHSLADISKAQRLLGYAPTQRIGEGFELAMPWYVQNDKASS